MSARPAAPSGFDVHREGRCVLIARPSSLGLLVDAGYGRAAAWDDRLREAWGAGRGGTVRVVLPDGERVVMKRMKRGGLAGRLWRDRFPGTRRLLENLSVPREAKGRGVPTAEPVALLLQRGPLGLCRGFLCVEEIAQAEDLLSRLRRAGSPRIAELGAVMAEIRKMHDAGVDHRDLNLGNVLVRRTGEGTTEVFVIDLDRAVLRRGPLRFGRRQAALRRIDRSYAKQFGERGPLRGDPEVWYRLYAGTDRRLARRLEAGRLAGRAWLALHRLGWRR